MANSIFKGDPFTGIGYAVYSDGYAFETTVSEWSAGLYTVDRGQLVDTSNPFNRMSLGQQGEFSMEQFSNGIYNVISQTTRGQVNKPVSTNDIRKATGTIDIMTPSGDQVSVDFAGVTVAKAGFQVVIYQQENGIDRTTQVKGTFSSTAELQAVHGVGYRLATFEETILNAATWEKISDLAKLIREEFSDEMTPEESTLEDYELVQSVIFRIGSLRDVKIHSSQLFQR